MHKTTPLLVQLDGQSLGDVTVSIDESKITPELANLNKTATTISTTASSSNTVLSTVADRLTAKNAAQEDKTAAQSAVDACAKLDAMQKTIVDDVVGDLQSADGKTTIFDCASATSLCLVDDPNAPAADQVRVGAAVKRIRDTIGQSTDADTESTTIGLLKKIKANTEGTSTITGTVTIKADQLATLATEATLGTRASETTVAKLGTEATLSTRATEATLALVSKDATTQSLKALVGTADDAADTSTVIGLLKKIKANTEGTGTISGTVSIQADQLATLATETTLGTRASEATLSTRATEATLALVSKDATTQSLKALVGTADDAAGTNTVIGLLKEIYAKSIPSGSIGTIAACSTVPGLTTWTTYDPITQDIPVTATYHYIILQEQNGKIQLAIFSTHGTGAIPKGVPSPYWPTRWNTIQHVISFPSQALGNTQPDFILYNTENNPVIQLTAKINFANNDSSVVSLFYTGSIANTLTIKS